jgi:hypothetical protein
MIPDPQAKNEATEAAQAGMAVEMGVRGRDSRNGAPDSEDRLNACPDCGRVYCDGECMPDCGDTDTNTLGAVPCQQTNEPTE